jgi:lysophospholipase L1-like esterase
VKALGPRHALPGRPPDSNPGRRRGARLPRVPAFVLLFALPLHACTPDRPVDRESDGAAGAAAAIRDVDGDGVTRIACVGDSNTQSIWQGEVPGGFEPDQGWCEQLEGLLARHDRKTVNAGLGGTRAVQDPSIAPGWSGAVHLAYALDELDPDAVILAYGTNDLSRSHATPPEVVEALRSLHAMSTERNVFAFIALTPPLPARDAAFNARVRELNALIREAFPPATVIDFWSNFEAGDFFEDGIHLNASGQTKRARAAAAAIERALAVRDTAGS